MCFAGFSVNLLFYRSLVVRSAALGSNPRIGALKTVYKFNEITSIEALLPNLALSGCIVAIDAMGSARRRLPRKCKHAAWRPDDLFDLLVQPMAEF